MPRIFDNIDQKLVEALSTTLETSYKADFCIGYFNLRGWKQIDKYIENMQGTANNQCRLLIGMQKLPEEELMELFSDNTDSYLDRKTTLEIKNRLMDNFKKQLIIGAPSNSDEAGLKKLVSQLKEGKVRVKLYLRTSLHAKLYLMYRKDPISPTVGYLGSSNLTFSGLRGQGELNVDVLDYDACNKLSKWFSDRWEDRYSLDITEDLIKILSESWAREEEIIPYNIYMKMIYHLSEEAQQGVRDVSIPDVIQNELLEFQETALKIAVQHIQKRNGVVIGDVVGLGKTILATSIARLYQENYFVETLILCPAKLVPMWEDYCKRYYLNAKVISFGTVIEDLDKLKTRYGLVILDESHNLRNKDGKRYKAVQNYINRSESKVVLLTATPYNKTYYDLSNQLRLFIPESYQFSIRPERLIEEMGETEFLRQYQCSFNSLEAFEHSPYAEDWQELMRLYMVRRTRSFILENYSKMDNGDSRKHIKFKNGNKAYFPQRIPKTLTYESTGQSSYSKLYSVDVLDKINSLKLPRYLLADYISIQKKEGLTSVESQLVENLGSARYLIGFYRTNVFKRLESSGQAFLISIYRHLYRDGVLLYALKNQLPVPIGAQSSELLEIEEDFLLEDEVYAIEEKAQCQKTLADIEVQSRKIYEKIKYKYSNKFKWISPAVFSENLVGHLESDSEMLLQIASNVDYRWSAEKDEKFLKLLELLTVQHSKQKVLIFSQFADTVEYLFENLKNHGVTDLERVTGSHENSTEIVWKFSPKSNHQKVDKEIRILIATDALSEGQNLQDSSIVINYDLPWAIIRLIQRAGRVDRIGQQAAEILCYSFMPVEGIENIINLRNRLLNRLSENAEVVGTDETFFEDQGDIEVLRDLYNEKSTVLEEQDFFNEVDLSSYAYEIWKRESEQYPDLEKIIRELPHVVYSSKKNQDFTADNSVIVYLRNKVGNDALIWMNEYGGKIRASQYEIIKAIECQRETPFDKKGANHHEIVAKALKDFKSEQKNIGGQLGKATGARFRVYEILKNYTIEIRNSIFADELDNLNDILNLIYKYPLTRYAADILNAKLRSSVDVRELIDTLYSIQLENRLCHVSEDRQQLEPVILCSMGLN